MIPSSPLHSSPVDPRLSGGAVVPPDLSAAGFTPSTDHHSPKGSAHPVEKVYSRSQQRDPPSHWHSLSNGSNSMSIEPPPPDMNGHGVKRAFHDMGDPLEDRRQHDPSPIASPNGLPYPTQVGYSNGHHPASSWESAPEEPHMDLHQDYDMRSDSGLNGVSEPSPGSSHQPTTSTTTTTTTGPHVSHNGVVRTDMGKRKRAFTNRTKTGCATCRRRKKKCDEGKPTCQNCARGGFECMGYSVKPALLGRDGQPLRLAQGRQPGDLWVENRNGKNGRGSTFEAVPNQTSVGMFDDRMSPRQTWQPAMNGGLGESRNLPSISASLGGLFSSGPQDYAGPLAAATSVLRDRFPGSTSRPGERNEQRSEGSARRSISHYLWVALQDELLVKDRRTCTTNCHQYNILAGSRDPKPDDLQRLFSKITQNGPLVKERDLPNAGKVGSNISVEAPFFCEFGYNLSIGDNVRIDRGCVIKDLGAVTIGDDVLIGANVLISTQITVSNPNFRRKAKAMRVIIGNNCSIGDGVKITSDDPDKKTLTIGDGTYVGAGTHVTQDVPAGIAIGPCMPGVKAWVVIGDFMKPPIPRDDHPRQDPLSASRPAPYPGPRQPSRQGSLHLQPPPPPPPPPSYSAVQPPLQSPLQSHQAPRQPPPHQSQQQPQSQPQQQPPPPPPPPPPPSHSQNQSPQQSHHSHHQSSYQQSYPPFQQQHHSPYQSSFQPLPSPKDRERMAAV